MSQTPTSGRTLNALIVSAYGYAQYALSIASAILLFPYSVRQIGVHDFGLWLATGEVVGYLLLLDPGVFSILPWLVAKADGSDNPEEIQQYLSDSLAVGFVMSLILILAAIIVWNFPAKWGLLPQGELEKIRLPLAILVGSTALSYPVKAYLSILAGLQDVRFTGGLGVLQNLLSTILTFVFLAAGYGLIGLSLAIGLPAIFVSIAGLCRAWFWAPQLFRRWLRPTFGGIKVLVTQGAGTWLSGLGYRLVAASNGVILTALGHPEWMTIYSATTKATQVLQQICWLAPDSGLVGLAQMHGQGDRVGEKRTVRCMVHIHVLTSGSALLFLLAFNPYFVTIWAGPELYAGDVTNLLSASNLFLASLVHAAVCAVSVVGNRMLIGVLTLTHGVTYCGLALVLGRWYGINGIQASYLITGILLGLIPGSILMGRVFDYGFAELMTDAILPWLARSLPFLIVALGFAPALIHRPVWQAVLAAAIFGNFYLWITKPLIAAVPWPVRSRPWLARLRLIPKLDVQANIGS